MPDHGTVGGARGTVRGEDKPRDVTTQLDRLHPGYVADQICRVTWTMLGVNGALAAALVGQVITMPDGGAPDDVYGWGFSLGLLLLAVRNVWRSAERLREPLTHPSVVVLSKRGGVQQSLSSIEQGLHDGRAVRLKRCTLTRQWLIQVGWFSVTMLPLQDVLWIYPKRTTLYAVILPVSREHVAIVRGRDGTAYEVRDTEANVQALLREIATRAPWSVVGYDPEFAKRFEDATKRAEIARSVDARREDIQRRAS